mgnify:CR=1 FL=1
MKQQYDVDVIEEMVKDGNQEGCSIAWWANYPQRIKNNDGTFTMLNCEMNEDGSFTVVGFAPVHIPKEAVKTFKKTNFVCL